MNENVEFDMFHKDKSHHIVVSGAYGSDDGYYWDKQYFLVVNNKPYIYLVIGSYSGWIPNEKSLKQVDFDFLNKRKKENTLSKYNDVSILDFNSDKESFIKLYKFMIDNNSKEVIETDDYDVETNSYRLEVIE